MKKTTPKNNQKPKSKNLTKSVPFKSRNLLIFAILFGVIAASVALFTYAAPKSRGATLSLEPASQKVSVGAPLRTAVWVDSGGQPVNTVQANLTYDPAKLDFLNIDSTGSAFELEAQSSGNNGTIYIARGHVGSVTGRQLVAIINFQPKASSGRTNINFASGSAIIRFTDYVNILQQTQGARYTLVL